MLDIRASGSGQRSARPLVWRGMIRYSADRVHKGVVEALSGGFTFTPYEGMDREAAGRNVEFQLPSGRSGRDRLEGRLAFRSALTDREQELLAEHRSQLIKLQFALWARCFAETDADPSRPTLVSLSKLCEDLGYRRQQNGSHRPEHKRQVAEWLELLTSLVIDADYLAPDGRRTRLTGPVWRRFPDWELDRTLAFAPGTWYAEAAWRDFNHQVGLISAELLQLRPDRDPWAICIGGYLACLARMNGYRPLTLRVSTLLERTGLGAAERRNPSRMREMLERALEQLETCGVIAEWDWFHSASAEPDMDQPDDLVRLASTAPGWEDRSLVIRWPAPLQHREQSLATAQRRRIPRAARVAPSPRK